MANAQTSTLSVHEPLIHRLAPLNFRPVTTHNQLTMQTSNFAVGLLRNRDGPGLPGIERHAHESAVTALPIATSWRV
jgi:hypothetical protein